MALGDLAGGIASMEEGIAAWFQTGAGAGASLMHAVVAEFQLAAGDVAAADRRLRQAETMVATTEERFYEAEILRLRGEIALQMHSDPDVARAWFMRGLALARAQGARSWELRLSSSLANHWLAHGRQDTARAVLSDCIRRFDEGFDTRDLTIATRLLADAA
jgi:adenylate cyclase